MTEPTKEGGVEFDPFAGPALERTAPSTEPQREIWTATQLGDDASCAFNESCTLALAGALDEPALQAALADLVARHEAVRTTFSSDGLTLCVAQEVPLPLERLDLSTLPAPEQEARVASLLAARVGTPFSLEAGPLIRFDLVRTGPERHLLVLTGHHIVCDGFSIGVLITDLARLYTARHRGQAPALPPAYSFCRYSQEQLARQGTPEHAADEKYWVSRFSSSAAPVLDLPTDRPRPRLKTYASRRLDVRLPSELVVAVKKAGARAGASFFATLLGALQALLSRLALQDDVVVGIASAGQATAGHGELVGHCVNTLPIRVGVKAEAPFSAFLKEVRGQVLDAQEHAEYTLGSLIRQLALPRDPSRLPLVSVLFNLDPGLAPTALAFDGLAVEFRSNPRQAENFDLFVNAVEVAGALQLETQYNTDLLDEATVRRWMAALERLLREASQHPDTPVARLPILPAEDEQQLRAWNQTGRAWPSGRLLHQLVEEQVDRTPDAVAVRYGDAALTYRELEQGANRLAHQLRALGAGPDVLVGISLERSLAMVTALLAVHKAGAAYVPLDPGFPAERLATMVTDSGMPLLLTERALLGSLQPGQARVIELDGADAAAIAAQPATRPPPAGRPDALAYVLYTSGSTGKPKGVEVPVSALVNFLWSVKDEPGVFPGDHLVAVTTLSFDIAGLELWLPLLVGATIELASREVAQDGAQLVALLQRSGAKVMQATPATWRLLLAAGWEGAPGFRIICGGEALPRPLAEQLVARGTVYNMYGPTETTIWSTFHRLEPQVGQILIGKPLSNQRVYVLDALGQPVPLGVPGELFIAGDGVARGYLGRPELTAERFVPEPGRDGPPARMYRTGDVVRLRSDGNLEFIGRNDGQVKVRGHRIELGEIEAALARHPTVAQAVALAREDRAGDARLVAYLVLRPGEALAEEALRLHLKAILPEYMVPQHLVALPAFPLTPNGKIDRKALPAPDMTASSDEAYVAPRTPAEVLLAGLWQEALGVGRVGVNDDFFTLGGHSLLAAQVIARLAREHGITVPMRRMFEAPTVASFAPLLDSGRPAVKIPHLPGDGPTPASFMQERIWNLEQLQPGRAVFNLPAAFRLAGALDPAALQRALDAFVARHEAARTTLQSGGDQVVQRVAPVLHLPLDTTDLSALPDSEREAALHRELLAASVVPFDLERGPLLRARLFRLGAVEHVLFVLPHHAIWDGWSFDVLVRDLAELYAAEVAGRAPRLPELTVRYRDFAAWHRGWLRTAEVEEQAAWWRGQLAGEVAQLELPTDRRRSRTAGDSGDTLWVEIPREEKEALSALAKENGATLFMVMLAAFQTVLHRWSGQEEVLVGTPLRGRAQPGLEDLVGTFINSLLLRTRFSGSPSFLEVLARVRTVVTEAFAHEDVPFELLSMSRKPVFRALFSFQDVRTRAPQFGDLALSQVHVLPPLAGNDVSLWVMEKDTGLVGGFNYAATLFDRTTAEGLLAGLRAVLRAVLEDPRTPVARLGLTGPAPAAVDDGGAAPVPEPLHAAFDRLLAADGEAPAVGGRSGAVSRKALDLRARALAAALQGARVTAGGRVALRLDDPADLASALLATSRLGAVAVSLDRDEPPARLAGLLARLAPAALVATAGEAPEDLACPLVELPLAGVAGQLAFLPPVDAGAAALIACTVGGGGEPRLVTLSHRGLCAAVDGVRQAAGLGPHDVLAGPCGAGPARQALELWLALRTGARLAPLDPSSAEYGEALGQALAGAGATALVAEPASWTALLDAGFPGAPGFKALCAGGPVSEVLADRLAALPAGALLVYGAAESGFWAAALPAAPGAPAGRLGGALPGVQLAVLDPAHHPLPEGVVGELAVAGATLADAIEGPADAVGMRLVADPVAPGGRWLLTGDRARSRAGAWLERLGRRDGLVQVQGRRLALEQVERALQAHPGVREAAAGLLAAGRDEQVLVTWWSPRPGEETSDAELRRFLRRQLPRHAVPQQIVEVAQVERRPDGTPDRGAVPASLRRAPRGATPPRTAEELVVAEVWRSALGLEAVHAEDNFFDLGGHSLVALQVIEQLARRTGRRVSPVVLLDDNLMRVAERLAAEPARP